ncbi:MAG: ABC transporter permease [Clostridia bacterium]|nr:ABC transporter permease [Clostridia bacterium]
MIKYIIKRVLMLIPVLLGISLLIFTVMNISSGDPARALLSDYASQEDVDKLREEMGLNDPFLEQYGRYIWNALHGDLGTSYQSGQPVVQLIAQRYPTTIKLALGSILLSIIFGIPIGILSAVKQYSLIDNASMLLSMLLTSTPSFWLGLMLLIVFSLTLHWLPATQALGTPTIKHFILPWITLNCMTFALLIRMSRSTMLEVIRQDYIRTAKAKGATDRRVTFKHALRNALLPIVTVIGTQLSVQLGGSVVVESVFALNGIGTMAINGIKAKDTPVVMAAIMFIAIVGGIINLLVDIGYVFIDPRLKSQFFKGKKKEKAKNAEQKQLPSST